MVLVDAQYVTWNFGDMFLWRKHRVVTSQQNDRCNKCQINMKQVTIYSYFPLVGT